MQWARGDDLSEYEGVTIVIYVFRVETSFQKIAPCITKHKRETAVMFIGGGYTLLVGSSAVISRSPVHKPRRSSTTVIFL
jgi:hypothetical protein